MKSLLLRLLSAAMSSMKLVKIKTIQFLMEKPVVVICAFRVHLCHTGTNGYFNLCNSIEY